MSCNKLLLATEHGIQFYVVKIHLRFDNINSYNPTAANTVHTVCVNMSRNAFSSLRSEKKNVFSDVDIVEKKENITARINMSTMPFSACALKKNIFSDVDIVEKKKSLLASTCHAMPFSACTLKKIFSLTLILWNKRNHCSCQHVMQFLFSLCSKKQKHFL